MIAARNRSSNRMELDGLDGLNPSWELFSTRHAHARASGNFPREPANPSNPSTETRQLDANKGAA